MCGVDAQREMEGCSEIGIVLAPDNAAIGFDQRPRDGQSEAEALLLRREERIEDLLLQVHRDAVSAIAHGYDDLTRRIHACSDLKPSLVLGQRRHRLHAVEEQVEQYLLHVDAVTMDRG